jgi:hypothetical protein
MLLWTMPELLVERSRSLALSARHSVLSAVGLSSSAGGAREWMGDAGSASATVAGSLGKEPPPHRIMQTWKDTEGDHGEAWLARNPPLLNVSSPTGVARGEGVSTGWRYHFLTDADALRFLRDVDPTQGDADKLSTIRHGAIKADFLRVVCCWPLADSTSTRYVRLMVRWWCVPLSGAGTIVLVRGV